MSWLSSIFSRLGLAGGTSTAPQLSEDLQARLAAWQALPEADLSKPFVQTEFVVLDLETSGFSFKHDRLIAIGACRLVNGLIPLGESFQIILKQEESSTKENILIHHIGESEQRSGVEPAEALMQFLEYMGKKPLVAYHVGFDQPMLDKALKQYLGIELKHHIWLDVAFLGPLFLPDVSTQRQSLDFWATHFNVKNDYRHQAVFDAIATAEVMQAVMKQPQKKQDNICVGECLDTQTILKMALRAQKIHRQLHGGR